MTDTLKQPAPTSAPTPFDPVAVGGGPAAILDIPRSAAMGPAAPLTTRQAPRQTQPIPPTPAPSPQPPMPVSQLGDLESAKSAPLPAPAAPRSLLPPDIAPEVPLTPEPNPLAGTPAPKASVFTGLVRDLIRPNRAKVAVLAGVASLAAGAFAMPLLFPSLSGGAQQPKAKVTLKVPADEPVAPAPVASAPVPGPLPTLNPTPLTAPPQPGPKPVEAGGWNPLEPALPPLPVTGGTGGRSDLPPPVDPRQQGAGGGALVAPRMPGDVTLPAVPGDFPAHQPTQPVFVDPNLRRVDGQVGTPMPVTPTPPPSLPPLPGAGGPAAPGGPALPDTLPGLPPLPGAGGGPAPVQPAPMQPQPVQPLPGLPALPVPGGPGGETLPTTPGMVPAVPGTGTMPLPGGAGGPALPALPAVGGTGGPTPPALPPVTPGGTNTGNTGGGPGVFPLPTPLPTPQPEVRPLPLPGGPGETRPQPEARPLPGFPGETKPLETKPAQLELPAIPGGGGFPPAPPAPRAEVERTGGTGTGFPTSNPGPALQPPVSEPKTDYDVDLHRPRAGDTYATVSRSFYGSAQYADALRTFNRNQPIERIPEVQVPPVHVIRKYAPARAAEPLPEQRSGDRDRLQPARTTPDDDPMWGPPGTAQGGQVVYTLFTVPRKGLTLKEVAKTFFGSERNWTKLNNGRNPKFDPDDELPVGTQLYVPTETVPFR